MNVDSTAGIRDQIWFLTKDAETHHIYYRVEANKHKRNSRMINFMLLGLSLAAAAGLLGSLQIEVSWAWLLTAMSSVILFFAIAFLTIVEVVFENSRNSGVAEVVSYQCQEIASEARKLQRKIQEPRDTGEVADRADMLRNLLDSVTRSGLEHDEELYEESSSDAEKRLASEFPRWRSDMDSQGNG